MTFSDHFQKALDAVTGFTPECVGDYMPDMHALRNGLHVVVFDDSAHGVFVCYGVIIASEWNAFVGDYNYEVQVCHSNRTINSWGWHMEMATPDALRMSFVKIEGGFE
jgi:hypothetical protein